MKDPVRYIMLFLTTRPQNSFYFTDYDEGFWVLGETAPDYMGGESASLGG